MKDFSLFIQELYKRCDWDAVILEYAKDGDLMIFDNRSVGSSFVLTWIGEIIHECKLSYFYRYDEDSHRIYMNVY